MPTATYTVPVTGPQSVTAFAELLAASRDAHVLVPVHPGFGGTHRPDGLTGAPALARLYNGLIDQLGLDVTVIGNSLGGWTAAEIALLRSPRGQPATGCASSSVRLLQINVVQPGTGNSPGASY